MSFEGHTKSLRMISRAPTTFDDRAADGISEDGETTTSRSTSRAGNCNGPNVVQQHPEAFGSRKREHSVTESILDERGNAPTRSLWVGNIPAGLTPEGARRLFSRFGRVGSIKIMPKFAFVNFYDVASGLAAWRECHNRDVFNTNNKVWIRFTKTENEAKQLKQTRHENPERLFLHGKRGSEPHADLASVKHSIDPSGLQRLPPTGPKFQRRNISPPPLRRSVTHRPELQKPDRVVDNERTEIRQEQEPDSHGPDIYRPFYHGFSSQPKCRRRGSTVSENSGGSTASSRSSRSSRSRNSRDKSRIVSPLPWERKTVTLTRSSPPPPTPTTVAEKTHGSQAIASEADLPAASVSCVISSERRESATQEQPANSVLGDGSKTGIERLTALHDPVDMLAKKAFAPFKIRNPVARSDTGTKLSPERLTPHAGSSEDVSIPRARFVSPFRQLQPQNDETSSTISGTTSSSQTLTRKRRCADCKKPGSTLSPLVLCSGCPRRFHGFCGDPNPSASCNPDYSCKRCVQKAALRSETGRTSHAAGGAASGVGESFDVRDVIPPRGPANREELLDGQKPDDSPRRRTVEPTPAPLQSCQQGFERKPSPHPSNAMEGGRGDLQTEDARPGFSTSDLAGGEGLTQAKMLAQEMYRRYKSVTCCQWKRGNSCHRTEPRCMFAHRETGYLSPIGTSPAKDWTCPQFLSRRGCPRSEQQCFYAHWDTGLYLCVSGKPSMKHITCYWWGEGQCKKSSEECLLAHEDTGIYSGHPNPRRNSSFAAQSETSSGNPNTSESFCGGLPRSLERQRPRSIHKVWEKPRLAEPNTQPSAERRTSEDQQKPSVVHVPTGPKSKADDALLDESLSVDGPEISKPLSVRRGTVEVGASLSSRTRVGPVQTSKDDCPSLAPKSDAMFDDTHFARPKTRRSSPAIDPRRLKRMRFDVTEVGPVRKLSNEPQVQGLTEDQSSGEYSRGQLLEEGEITESPMGIESNEDRRPSGPGSCRKCRDCSRIIFKGDLCSSCKVCLDMEGQVDMNVGRETQLQTQHIPTRANAPLSIPEALILEELTDRQASTAPTTKDESLKSGSKDNYMFLSEDPEAHTNSTAQQERVATNGSLKRPGRDDHLFISRKRPKLNRSLQSGKRLLTPPFSALSVDNEKRELSQLGDLGQQERLREVQESAANDSGEGSLPTPDSDGENFSLPPCSQRASLEQPSTIVSPTPASPTQALRIPQSRILHPPMQPIQACPVQDLPVQQHIIQQPALSARAEDLQVEDSLRRLKPDPVVIDAVSTTAGRGDQNNLRLIRSPKRIRRSAEPRILITIPSLHRSARPAPISGLRSTSDKCDDPNLNVSTSQRPQRVRLQGAQPGASGYEPSLRLSQQPPNQVKESCQSWGESSQVNVCRLDDVDVEANNRQHELGQHNLTSHKLLRELGTVADSVTQRPAQLPHRHGDVESDSTTSDLEDQCSSSIDGDIFETALNTDQPVRGSSTSPYKSPERACSDVRATDETLNLSDSIVPLEEKVRVSQQADVRKVDKRTRPAHDINAAIERLKQRGITFESDTDSGDDGDGEEGADSDEDWDMSRFMFQAKQGDILNPLKAKPLHSRDLYELEPQLCPGLVDTASGSPISSKFTKGQGLKQPMLARKCQMLGRTLRFGNAHREVRRYSNEPLIKAMIQRQVRSRDLEEDRYAPDELVDAVVHMTFRKFLDAPEEVEACLVGQRSSAQLAFREKPQDDGSMMALHKYRVFDQPRRKTDVERWPVQER